MFGNLTPITRNIVILNVLVYLLSNFIFKDWYITLSAFYPFSPNFHPWQIITHMFMHAPMGEGMGITHIIFNMFTLISFGPVLEQVLGEKRYIFLYFVSGLGSFALFNLWNFYQVNEVASQLQTIGVDLAEIYRRADVRYYGDMMINTVNPQGQALSQELFSALRSPMLGASGAIFGIVAAFATLFPDAKLMFMFIPFPIKAKYLLPVIIIVSVYLGFSGDVGGIAHFAHVGGAITGFLLAKIWKRKQYRIN